MLSVAKHVVLEKRAPVQILRCAQNDTQFHPLIGQDSVIAIVLPLRGGTEAPRLIRCKVPVPYGAAEHEKQSLYLSLCCWQGGGR